MRTFFSRRIALDACGHSVLNCLTDMRETITISLPKFLRRDLDRAAKEERMNRSDLVREALRQFFAIREFRRLRRQLIPLAEKRGLYKDEDIFERVS